jgi:hypothetical protein
MEKVFPQKAFGCFVVFILSTVKFYGAKVIWFKIYRFFLKNGMCLDIFLDIDYEITVRYPIGRFFHLKYCVTFCKLEKTCI